MYAHMLIGLHHPVEGSESFSVFSNMPQHEHLQRHSTIIEALSHNLCGMESQGLLYSHCQHWIPAVSPIQGLSRGHPKVARGHPKVLLSHSPLTPGSPPTGNLPQRGHGCRTFKHKGGTHTLWFLATVNSPQICVCHTMELRSLWVIFRVAPFAG